MDVTDDVAVVAVFEAVVVAVVNSQLVNRPSALSSAMALSVFAASSQYPVLSQGASNVPKTASHVNLPISPTALPPCARQTDTSAFKFATTSSHRFSERRRESVNGVLVHWNSLSAVVKAEVSHGWMILLSKSVLELHETVSRVMSTAARLEVDGQEPR